MAWFNPPALQAGRVEGIGPTHADTSPYSGHPATYLKTEEQSFAALRLPSRCISLPCMQGRVGVGCCCFCALGARCFSRGPSAAVSRGRPGRAAGIAMEGDAFSTGQESGRKARPRLTDFPSMDGRKAPPRGVVSSWLLLLWTSKGEVTRAPAGARNRSVARDNAEARAPSPTLSRRERVSPISARANSCRSASLLKVGACGAWSMRTGTSNIPDSSELDQPSAVEKHLAGMTSKIRASLMQDATQSRHDGLSGNRALCKGRLFAQE